MSKNMKLLGIASLTALILLTSAGMVSAKGSQNSSSYNDVMISVTADVAEGQLTLSGINETGKELKVMVKKDEIGSETRWYDVTGNYEISANVIFEDGLGEYNIYAMIKEEETKYTYGPSLLVKNIGETQKVAEETVVRTESNITYTENYTQPENNQPQPVKSESKFTKASKDIDSDNSQIIELSKTLTRGKETQREKIEAIYTWVADNITYDYDKYSNMLAGNYSDRFGSLSALETKKGVCYDFSTLLAALCRAQGIEAKVAKGYSLNIVGYHAWNEVFDSESNEWIILDATIESSRHIRTNADINFTVRASDEYSKTEEM